MRTVLARLRLVLFAFGWRGIVRRASYLVRLRSGWLRRRLPVEETFDTSPRVAWLHRFDVGELRAAYQSLADYPHLVEAIKQEAASVLAGDLRLYGGAPRAVGWPPRWHVNPFTGNGYPRVHWTAISDDDAEHGDIKDVWEPSRLPFTFVLARAFVVSGDDRYVETWWQAIEDWARHNPPNLGANWRCGQESSLRAVALSFGLSVFGDHPATTGARRQAAERILGATAARVRPTVGYALSQRNNHAISELVCLLTLRAGSERRLHRLLIEVLDDQFYPDGSYGQQSFTYQRLAVQTLQWLLAVRTDLPPRVRMRVVDVLARSRDFLARCSDPVSGWLPNYGPNDGTLLFHLDAAHYRDFRPLLASLGATASRAVDAEPSLWLADPQVNDRRTDAVEQPSTYRTLRGPRSLVLTRIGTGRHRAAHDDQQAVDVWIDGHNVIPDPGTYRYSAPEPWRNALTSAHVHSLPMAIGEQAFTLGRFLTGGMAAAELVHHSEQDGYEVLVARRRAGMGWLWRAIVRSADAYAVADVADGTDAVVRWNVAAEVGTEVTHAAPDKVEPTRSRNDDPRSGWVSPVYGYREPIEARLVSLTAGQATLTRVLRPGEQGLAWSLIEERLKPQLPQATLAALESLRSG